MNSIRQVTVWGLVLNILLTICKFAVGLIFKSQACLADAVHSMSDFLSDIAVLVGVRFWSAPADSDHPHGHQRIEALITLFIGVLLSITALGMAVNAIETIFSSQSAAPPGTAVLYMALLSIVIKEFLYQWTAIVAKSQHSTALLANAWHHRSDALSSIPVALVAAVGRYWPNASYLDPVGAIIVSAMLLCTAWRIAMPCLRELSDQGVNQVLLEQMRSIASSIPGIKDVHELRTRRLGDGILLDMHILVDKDMSVESGHRLGEEAGMAIRHKMPFVLDVLTHIEPYEAVSLEARIEAIARSVNGVKEVHNIRIRSVLSGYDADLHIQVAPDLTVAQGHKICGEVKAAILSGKLGIVGALTHLEPYYSKE